LGRLGRHGFHGFEVIEVGFEVEVELSSLGGVVILDYMAVASLVVHQVLRELLQLDVSNFDL